MSDQERKEEPTTISPQPDAENKKKSTELSEEQLNKVTGGREASAPSIKEIVVSKPIDISSP